MIPCLNRHSFYFYSFHKSSSLTRPKFLTVLGCVFRHNGTKLAAFEQIVLHFQSKSANLSCVCIRNLDELLTFCPCDDALGLFAAITLHLVSFSNSVLKKSELLLHHQEEWEGPGSSFPLWLGSASQPAWSDTTGATCLGVIRVKVSLSIHHRFLPVSRCLPPRIPPLCSLGFLRAPRFLLCSSGEGL